MQKCTRNQLMVARNSSQGTSERVLTVCTGGVLRSPTIAKVLLGMGYNARSCGVDLNWALIPVSEVLLHWAERIVFAEQSHLEDLRSLLKRYEIPDAFMGDKQIQVLNIPDVFSYDSPMLVGIIEEALDSTPIVKWRDL